MKYCKKCGKEMSEDSAFCPNCGATLEVSGNENSKLWILWGIISILFPIVGIVLFFAWKVDAPKSSKAAGIGALIGMILVIICYFSFFSSVYYMIQMANSLY